MAFVNAYLTKKEKELLGSWKIRKEEKFIDPSIYKSWNVDKEREIYFIYLGGGTLERPSIYALIWKSKKVIISVESRSYKDNVHWLIESIKASKALEHDKEKIVEIIKEVVPISYGCNVIFEVFPEPVFVEEEILNG